MTCDDFINYNRTSAQTVVSTSDSRSCGGHSADGESSRSSSSPRFEPLEVSPVILSPSEVGLQLLHFLFSEFQ